LRSNPPPPPTAPPNHLFLSTAHAGKQIAPTPLPPPPTHLTLLPPKCYIAHFKSLISKAEVYLQVVVLQEVQQLVQIQVAEGDAVYPHSLWRHRSLLHFL